MVREIAIENLTVRRGGRTVLDGFSCHISAGKVTGLLGPSGAGKTTVIRSIVGVQRLSGGSVTVFGHAAGAREMRRHTGYMTQGASIYADLTVVQNVRYFATILGCDRIAVGSILDEVGLGPLRHRLTSTLSGGQRSRVSMACALVGDPSVIILDEPTAGQDPLLREELWGLFRRRADRGAAVLVSSHVMEEARRCDRLLLMRGGALLASGTPGAVCASVGADDLDAAFLALVRRGRTVGGRAVSERLDDTARDSL